MRKGGRKSQEHSYRTRESKGVTGVYSFNIEATGLSIYKPIPDKDKPNKVAFLLYFPGDKDPIQGKLPENEREYTHILDFWDHNIPNVGRYVCLLNTYGKPCPVCEWLKANRTGDKEKDSKNWNMYKPTRRGVYAVWDLADKNAGPKVWYSPFNFIEIKVQGQAKDPETGETIYYTDPDEGANCFFTFIDKGNFQYDFDNFQLKARKDPIPDSILEKVPSLDQFLIVPTYDEVRQAFDPHGTTLVEQELDTIQEEHEEEEGYEKEVVEEEVVEEPKPKSKTRIAKKLECPAGGVFGEDFGNFDEECDECEFFDKCSRKYDELHEMEDEGGGDEPEDDFPEEEPVKEEPKRERKPLRRRT